MRGIKQKVLAQQVGLTESSLSMILNAKARPRQLTLSRLMQRLNCDAREQQRILSAYDHTERVDLPLRPGIREVPTPQDEVERVERYMRIKCESVQFERAVAAVLDRRGFAYVHPHIEGTLICDFYLAGPPSTVLECKWNTKRDWDRTITTVKILRQRLACDRVMVVVPEEDVFVAGARDELEASQVRVVTLSGLEESL